LEESIWCLFTTDNYHDAVLKAVNLGSDTDTTAAVTGGLAGLLYGFDNIPPDWLQNLTRFNDIENLVSRMSNNLYHIITNLYICSMIKKETNLPIVTQECESSCNTR